MDETQQPSDVDYSNLVEIEVDPALAAELEAAAQQGDTWFKCGTCGEHYNDLSVLLAHLQVHQDDVQPEAATELTLSSDTTLGEFSGVTGSEVTVGSSGLVAANVDISSEFLSNPRDVSADSVSPTDMLSRGGPFKLQELQPLPGSFLPSVVLDRIQVTEAVGAVPEIIPSFAVAKGVYPTKVVPEIPAPAPLVAASESHATRKRGRKFECPDCGDYFVDQSTFKAHMRIHSKNISRASRLSEEGERPVQDKLPVSTTTAASAAYQFPQDTVLPDEFLQFLAGVNVDAGSSGSLTPLRGPSVSSLSAPATFCPNVPTVIATPTVHQLAYEGQQKQVLSNGGSSTTQESVQGARVALAASGTSSKAAALVGNLQHGNQTIPLEPLGNNGTHFLRDDDHGSQKQSRRCNRPVCHHCGVRFVSRRNLKRHLRNIHEDYSLDNNAVVTEYGAVVPPNVTVGMVPHDANAVTLGCSSWNSNIGTCRFCGFRFAQARNLRRHLKIVHKDSSAMVNLRPRKGAAALADLGCQVCGVKISNSANLRRHLQSAHKDIPYQRLARMHDKFILESAVEHSTLTDAGLEDDGRRPHVCNLCGDRFTLRNTLRQHIKTDHAGATVSMPPPRQRLRQNEAPPPPILRPPAPKMQRLIKTEPIETAEESNDGSAHGGGTEPERIRKPVELYTCRLCERQFLTTFGLERHAKIAHPDDVDDLLRELKQFARARHEMATAAAASAGSPGQGQTGRVENRDRGYVVRPAGPRGRGPGRQSDAGGGQVFVCSTCGLQLFHVHAMQSHIRAHQRNQELREQLLRQHGAEAVNALTCVQCKVVFKDQAALENHMQTIHQGQQQRMFECHTCKDRFPRRDLLLDHIRRTHGFDTKPTHGSFFECQTCQRKFISERSLLNHCQLNRHQPPPGLARPPAGAVTRSDTRRIRSLPEPNRFTGGASAGGSSVSSGATGNAASDSTRLAAAGPTVEPQCRAICDLCSAVVPKPSLLIRHVKSVHNRTNFTATVETEGMPSFKIDVYGGKFTWSCCEEIFDERASFTEHRRNAHSRALRSTGFGAQVQPVFRCPKCDNLFSTVDALVHHVRSCHNMLMCRYCKQSFSDSVQGLESYGAHMLVHQRDGTEDLSKGQQLACAAQLSEDEVSIFSESGVESEADEQKSDTEDLSGLQSCPVCEKKFSCVYRFDSHWHLHCRSNIVATVAPFLKTKPYSFKTLPKYHHCAACKRIFKTRLTLTLHQKDCIRRKFGTLPKKLASEEVSASTTEQLSFEMKQPEQLSPLMLPARMEETRSFKSPSKPSESGGNVSGLSGGGNEDQELMSVEECIRKPDELEDTLDIKPNKKRNGPVYVERAYVVEWDTNKTPTDNPYKCKTCESCFGDFLSLIQHIKSHIPYPVTKDAEGLISDASQVVQASVIQIRSSAAPTNAKFPCQICTKRFGNRTALEDHIRQHKPRKQHRCVVCGHHFWKRSALLRHARRHNPRNRWCMSCGKKFMDMDSLKKHQARHELMNSLYQCEDCSLTLYSLQALKRHFYEKHRGIKMHSCPLCSLINSDAQSMRQHIKTEHLSANSTCAVCMKKFGTPFHAAMHVRRVHTLPAEQGSLSCTLCSKQFQNKQLLAVHLWRHTGERPFQCRICDAGFDNEDSCRQHIAEEHRHSDGEEIDIGDNVVDNLLIYGSSDDRSALKGLPKCFRCYVCRRRFGSKLSVRMHVFETHQREPSFRCNVCAQQFRSQGRLSKHAERQHNNQNPNHNRKMSPQKHPIRAPQEEETTAEMPRIDPVVQAMETSGLMPEAAKSD